MKFQSKIALCLVLLISSGQALANDAELVSRISKLERMIDNRGLLNILDELHSLQKEVQVLRGEVEQQAYTIEQLKKRNQNLYDDLDQRIKTEPVVQEQSFEPVIAPVETTPEIAIETVEPTQREVVHVVENTRTNTSGIVPVETYVANQGSVTTSAEVEQIVETTDYPQTVPDTETNASEEEQYSEAFNLLKLGKNEQSITKFRSFIERYPTSSYADNSQYWLGEAFYAKRDFNSAVEEYKLLLANYPDSGKASHAQLKLAYSYDEMGEKGFAQSELEDLIARYPGTSAASLAEERLAHILSH